MKTEFSIPLIEAAGAGDLEAVRNLLDRGADPSIEIGDRANEASETPLGAAVRHGHRDVVELLLDRGADLNGNARGGLDFITVALLAGHLHLADLLYRRGGRTRLLIGLCFVGNYAAVHEILAREPQRWGEYAFDSIRSGQPEMLEENLRRNSMIDPVKNGFVFVRSAIFQWRLVIGIPAKSTAWTTGSTVRAFKR